MNLELTEEQVAVRDTVRRFLAEKASVNDHVRPLFADASGTTESVWRGLADLGTTSLLVPEEHGGAGASMVEAGVVAEELGAGLYAGPWLSTAIAAPRAMARFGTAGAAAGALYSGIADGSTTATVAVADRGVVGVRHQPSGVTIDARLDSVPDVAAADVLLIAADDDLYAVRLPHKDARAARIEGIDDSRRDFRVVLDGVPGSILGHGEPGAATALTDDMIIGWGADALGAARQVLQLTVEYAKTRHQFGAPIGSFQAIAHLCVDMYETVELARCGVQHALWAADFADHTERHRAALRVKAFSGRLATVGDTAIQVFGGIGFTWDHDAQLYLKRLLGFTRFLGGPGAHLELIGRELVRSAT